MARKIADTKKMTHDEWVALRKSSIGGSDAAVCVNMNPYSGLLTLYADKKGLIEIIKEAPMDFIGSIVGFAGILFIGFMMFVIGG